jgi:hypothetical protein
MPVNDLQLGLIGAGAAVVAVVWMYNLWQERQHKKLAEKIFKGGQPDVLLQGQADEERAEPSVEPAMERIEPAVGPLAEETGEPPALPVEWVDEIAECLVWIEFPCGISAPALWNVQAAWAEQLSKALGWFGYDAERQSWRKLTAHDAGSYRRIVAALQLADRQGAVSEAEVSLFLASVQRLAQQFEGEAELPHPAQVLEHAQALDGFCASVDVQLSVNVVETAGGSFIGTKLRGLAEAAGLVLEDDGRFHARADDGTELFTLANLGPESFSTDSLKTLAAVGIGFVLDVPRTADGGAIFDRMVATARQMAQALGGSVVDGQRHELTDAMVIGIRSKLVELQKQMVANQIPPGSARALRLFS